MAAELPVPNAIGILPSAHSEETSLRNPAALGFLRRSIGTGNPSQLHGPVDQALPPETSAHPSR